jgi:RNA polymerase sigma factor (sigma-70 family)
MNNCASQASPAKSMTPSATYMPPVPVHNSVSEWFRRWRSPLRKFLVGRGVARVADLDDVAQEVFLRLLRYESAEVVQHPQAYIFKMAANVAAEWAIRSRHRLAHEPRWLSALVAQDTIEETFDNQVVQREIKRAIGTLTARERAIVKLHFEEGLSKAEIALRLALSPRVVQRDFETSYSKLRRELALKLTGVLSHGRE